jgi:glycosyltransferase involved in cell wall biosynthesis
MSDINKPEPCRQMHAKVSTIIPAYNAEQTIREAIDSALGQEFDGHQEVIVVDDGSTDSTAAVLVEYGTEIRVVSRPNGGPAAGRNAGVAASTGDYLAFLDSDDIWMPGKLKAMVAVLERNSRASLAFSEYINIGEDKAEFEESSIGHAPSMEEMMIGRPPIIPSTWVLPREMFERSGGFSEAFRGAGLEDSWMVILLRELGEFEYVPERFTLYRPGESSKIADKYGRGLSIFIALARERYGSGSAALVRNAKDLQCRWMLSKVAYLMNRGDRPAALRTLADIARLRPSYFLSAEFLNRLFLSQNLKRFRELTVGTSRPL